MIIFDGQELQDEWLEEYLQWIPEKKNLFDEESYAYSKNFVKSLGLKSDSVGWCELESNVNEEIVKKIYQKVAEENAKVRAYYHLGLSQNYPSEWYIVNEYSFTDYSNAMDMEEIIKKKNTYTLESIRGYKILPRDTILSGENFMMFQKTVVDFLKEIGIDDLDYMWVKDIGRYQSIPYFFAMPKEFVHWCFDDEIYRRRWRNKEKKSMSFYAEGFGSKVKFIWDNSEEIHVDFPTMVSRQELRGREIYGFGRQLLVSKRIRELLIENKLAKVENFEPVLTSDRDKDSPPRGLEETHLGECYIPEEIWEQYRKLYEKDLQKKKPKYVMTHKKVLATLKRMKRMDKESFSKPLPTKKLHILLDDRLTELYRISNGGYFSSEYFYYAAEELEKVNEEFKQEMELEELVEIPEGAVIFGGCADGEYILLLPDDTVARYQVGENFFETQWQNMDNFIYEAIMEDE